MPKWLSGLYKTGSLVRTAYTGGYMIPIIRRYANEKALNPSLGQPVKKQVRYPKTPLHRSLLSYTQRHYPPLGPLSAQRLHQDNMSHITRTMSTMPTSPGDNDFWSWVLQQAGNIAGYVLLGLSSYSLYQLARFQHQAREQAIIASPIETDTPVYDEQPTDQAEHGTLTTKIIGYQNKTFLKKGAKDRESLLKEFIVADALHELYPETQPQALILQEKLDDKRAQFFTLSEIRPGSMDFQDFIKSGWEEKLKDKPLLGFERTLAMVGLIAGQQDCKFANMIIVDKGTHYEAALIDHELSGEGFFYGLNRHFVTNDFSRLSGMIRDLQPVSDEQFGQPFRFGLTDDPRGQAFIDYVKSKSMDKSVIDQFHMKVAEHDFSATIDRLKQLCELTTLVNHKDVAYWQKEFATWQKLSKRYCEENNLSEQAALTP